MTDGAPIRLFQFPRMFSIPNLSPFCCKLETWLRIAGVPYEVVDTPDPRRAPKGKLPFIEDGGLRMGDTSLIIEHLRSTRGVDPDAGLSPAQRATALLVQRTLEEHYAFVLLYTHFIREQGWRHTQAAFERVPPFIRPVIAGLVRGRMRRILRFQGLSRHSDAEIMEFALQDWRAVFEVMSDGPFFFGNEPRGVDAIVFATLASTILTPMATPVRDYLRSQPTCVAYVERMRSRFFPELGSGGHLPSLRGTAVGRLHRHISGAEQG
jgi:glutathione S-transferase